MGVSPDCSGSGHTRCPGYYRSAFRCACPCHRPAGALFAAEVAKAEAVEAVEATADRVVWPEPAAPGVEGQ